jgi:hypothetical protein
MELIPILSFIILVATVSTFILSIGAYILYKIREGKGKLAVTPKHHTVEAQLYTPAQHEVKKEIPVQQRHTVYQKSFQQISPDVDQPKPGEYNYKHEKFQHIESLNGTHRKQKGQQREYKAQSEQEGQLSFGNEEGSTGKKFMKYTPEDYVPVNKIKTGENLKWR